ncbi:MAG TPA: glycosyltransferase N-terminal domain-containing protein [Candidatus Hydrogenedentes bacterium]|nr:glycosyltransferase N-terminal domain-containing protein [Candidatus Hydrogenedentota bacterium]
MTLYNALWTGAAPFGAAWLAASSRHRRLLGRFRPHVPRLTPPPLWFHACSVGEINAATPLVAAARKRWPDVPILLTTSTIGGWEMARAVRDVDGAALFPFDHPWCVRGFLDRAAPRALLLIETELWPNIISMTSCRDIPVLLVSGRLSDQSFPSYRRAAWFLRAAVGRIAAAGMQNETCADRLCALGGRRENVSVTGNIKFDLNLPAMDEAAVRALKTECGFPPDARIVLFGSTRPGDEQLAARCWDVLRDRFPDVRLVIAPRHLDRLGEAMAPFQEPLSRRSEGVQTVSSRAPRVFALDTLGELSRFYAMAAVAVIGGSFFSGVGGHNPIEPAAQGVPVILGPDMRSFGDAARVLTDAGGAVQLSCPDELPDALCRLLTDSAGLTAMGHFARRAMEANRGAIGRTLELIARTVPGCAGGHDADAIEGG